MLFRSIYIGFVLFICFLLQSYFKIFELAGIRPDFLLLLVIYFSIVRGSFAGIWIGFFSGWLQDINLSGIFIDNNTNLMFFWGVHFLPKAFIGYFAGSIVRWVNSTSFMFSALLIFLATLLDIFCSFSILAIFHGNFSLDIILSRLIPSALYNMCFSLIYIRFFNWIFTFTYKQLNEN